MSNRQVPADIAYEETAIALPANKVPEKVPGLWNFVEVLDTDDATNAQEVSFNGGNSWTRLRKGLAVRIGYDERSGRYLGTTELQFRNPTGGAVALVVAVGMGDFIDARLLIDATQGVVPVSLASPPVRTLSALGGDTGLLVQAAGAPATAVVVAGGANVNGIRILGLSQYAEGDGAQPGEATLMVNGVPYLPCKCSQTAGVHFGVTAQQEMLIPAGQSLGYFVSGKGLLYVLYKVL